MTKRIENILTAWLAANMGKTIEQTDYITANGDSTTWATMARYIDFERVTERVYWTVQELVKAYNACAGEDCYGGCWHLEIDEQGRPYEIVERFLIKGWR